MKTFSEIGPIIAREARENPSAVICIARAIALTLIIMFLTPISCSVINGENGRDYVIIWSDDVTTFNQVYKLVHGLLPRWDYTEPENSTEGTYSPFPVPASGGQNTYQGGR